MTQKLFLHLYIVEMLAAGITLSSWDEKRFLLEKWKAYSMSSIFGFDSRSQYAYHCVYWDWPKSSSIAAINWLNFLWRMRSIEMHNLVTTFGYIFTWPVQWYTILLYISCRRLETVLATIESSCKRAVQKI